MLKIHLYQYLLHQSIIRILQSADLFFLHSVGGSELIHKFYEIADSIRKLMFGLSKSLHDN
jgi:hypothetical protein